MKHVVKIAIDVIAVLFAFFFAYFLRDMLSLTPLQPYAFYTSLVLVSPPTLLLSFTVYKIYRKKRLLFSLSYLVDYVRGIFLWGGIVVGFAFFTKTDYSRIIIALFFIFTVILTLAVRLLIAWLQKEEIHKDSEINSVLNQVVHLSKHSPDTLSLLEGLNSKSNPEVFYIFFKRVFDIVLSLFGLVIFVVFLPFVAYTIKRDSNGTVFIKQERVGKRGEKFKLYKLRTMKIETNLYEPAPRSDNDIRITRIGKYLRKYSLDELPQLINVLKGDMSIVGPRPEMPFIVENYSEWQKVRLTVKPGITGLWQVLGRKDVPLEENIQYDFYYIFNRSFFLDMAIIIRTIPHLFFPRGAY